MSQSEMTYEKAVKRLEEIAAKLENGEDSLDGAMKLFEESVKLSDFCYKKLEEYKGKVSVLTENGQQDFDTGNE